MPTPSFAVAHLLRRAGFGGTAAEVAALAPLDIKEIVARVLDVDAPRPLPRPSILTNEDAGHWERRVAMVHAWLDEMCTTGAPIVEKMTLFWHGHFCSSLDKVGHVPMWEQNQLFRQAGLGSFRDLAQAVAVDPAMLRYLDNDRNVKGAPNENFARESMELFTLGVGHYSQDDVVAVARAWTGHGRDDEGRYRFRSDRHDAGPKTVFGITKAWTGPQVLDEILVGSKQDVSARFLARKLWAFLAYPEPEPAVVEAIVRPYVASGLEIKALLHAIFLRPEFYSLQARRGLVRTPVEYTVAAMRSTGLPCAVAHPEWWLEGMGQAPFSPPNVSGWRPNGYWVSPSAQWAKAAFAGHLRWKASERGWLADTAALSPGDAVRHALRSFGVDQPAAPTITAMETWLRAERETSRWAEHPNLIMLSLLSPDMQLA